MSKENLLNSSDNDVGDAATLSELFDSGFELFNIINKSDDPVNYSKKNIKKAMKMLEDATRLVSLVDMFSNNEKFEEIPTENIKYLLLPALLGTLTTKIYDSSDRAHVLKVAEVYYIDFLKRVKSYRIVSIDIPRTEEEDSCNQPDEPPSRQPCLLPKMVLGRITKLDWYKERKKLESRLLVLEKNLSNPNIDDETKREYFVTLIKFYVNTIIDDMTSLGAELRILKHMKMKRMLRPADNTVLRSLQPIIITRNEIQKKVYGAGYPSLPVYTVEEFYEQKVKDGEWADPAKHNQMNAKCLQGMANCGLNDKTQEEVEEIEKEEKIEKDDPELLEQARAMDEYKDTHRRGWGNRANRS